MGRAGHFLAILVVAALMAGCTGLIFQPMHRQFLDPTQRNVVARDIWFTARDGVRLHGWFLPSKGVPKGSLLFLHGNAQNISAHIVNVWWLPERGYNVFLFDYRGYGRSEGEPTLAGVKLDTEAALNTLLTMDEVDPQRVAVFGQSLGGGIAITTLADSPHKRGLRALIVEGTPSSYRTVARELLGKSWVTWLFQWPLSFTVTDDYSPLDSVKDIAPLPLLIVQSRSDAVIAPHHGEELYQAAHKPKELWLVNKAPHIGAFSGKPARDRLVDYLDSVMR